MAIYDIILKHMVTGDHYRVRVESDCEESVWKHWPELQRLKAEFKNKEIVDVCIRK